MKNLQKHLTTISNAKSNTSRPILQNIHFSQTHQALIVTDSYRLLKFNTPVSQSFNINPLTFELSNTDTTYPDVSRLIPSNHNSVIHFESKHITTILTKLFKLHKTSILTVDVNYDTKQVEFYDNETFITSIPYDVSQGNELLTFLVNAKYLSDMFNFMLDYHKESPSTITLGHVTALRPVTFSTLEYTYLITPIRMKESK